MVYSGFILMIIGCYVTFVYGLAAFLYIASWFFKQQLLGRLATWTAIIGVAGNTAGASPIFPALDLRPFSLHISE